MVPVFVAPCLHVCCLPACVPSSVMSHNWYITEASTSESMLPTAHVDLFPFLRVSRRRRQSYDHVDVRIYSLLPRLSLVFPLSVLSLTIRLAFTRQADAAIVVDKLQVGTKVAGANELQRENGKQYQSVHRRVSSHSCMH